MKKKIKVKSGTELPKRQRGIIKSKTMIDPYLDNPPLWKVMYWRTVLIKKEKTLVEKKEFFSCYFNEQELEILLYAANETKRELIDNNSPLFKSLSNGKEGFTRLSKTPSPIMMEHIQLHLPKDKKGNNK